MMRTKAVAGNPEVKRVVDTLLKSALEYERYENRSAIRESLVLPTRVSILQSPLEIPGLTRNISATGVGLLLPASVDPETHAVVSIERADGSGKCNIISECRWCKPFGKSWFFSGWQLIQVKRRVH